MSVYGILRPLLFALVDAEKAHDLTIGALKRLPILKPRQLPQGLAIEVAGIKYPSPIGLAAGFDKNGEVPDWMLGLGFASVEVGTVTPRPQKGNPGKRLYRLVEDEAVINRFGFNNQGHAAVEERLAARDAPLGIVGVNVGANRDSSDPLADYVLGVRRFSRYANYISINVSSPNTPGLRALQHEDHLPRLLEGIAAARKEVEGPPIFLKVAPDLSPREIAFIARASLEGGVAGLIVSNTTVARSADLKSKFAGEMGGLSGKPLKPLALAALRAFRSELGSRMPLIAVGGISSGADAYERIRAGASLVQVYTALAYKGPRLVHQIQDEILELMRADGLSSVREAVGAEVGRSRSLVKSPPAVSAPSVACA